MKTAAKQKLLKGWHVVRDIAAPVLSFVFPPAAPAIAIGVAAESAAEAALKKSPAPAAPAPAAEPKK